MRRALFVPLAILCCALPLQAEDPVLGLRELLTLILDRNPDVRQAADVVSHASLTLEAVQADRLPELAMGTGYDFDYQSRRQDAGNQYENSAIHSVTMSFSAKQLLPTYGTLELDVGDTLTLATLGAFNGAPTDPRFVQTPALTVTLDQPVFCNGRFIDGRVYPSVLQKQELTKQAALETERAVRNKAIAGVFGLVFDVQNLRNLIGQREMAIEIRTRGLSRLKKSLESGIVAQTDVAEMSVEIGKDREVLLQAVYQLATKEDGLRSALGMRQGSPILFDDDLADSYRVQPPPGPQTGGEDLGRNPSLALLELNLAGRRIATILNGFEQAASLTSTLSVGPRYPYSRTVGWDQDFGSSFSAFFDPLAGIDVSFSIEMNVPLFSAGKDSPRQSADLTYEKIADEALSVERERLAMQLGSLSLRERNLLERARLLTDTLELLERQRDMGRKLLEIGQITELDFADTEVESLLKENELKRTHMDLFLAALERLSLLGLDLDEELQQWEK